MPTDTEIDEIVLPDWPLATSEDDIRTVVRQRARRIRLQRRTPAAAVGLGIVALLVAVSLPNGTQPSSVRTADDGSDESYIVDEDRTVEHEGTGANAKARAKSDRKGTSGNVSAEARKDGETVHGTGAEVHGTSEPTVALTGHPLVKDGANDDAGLTSNTDQRVHGEHQPAADLLTGDIILDGSDLVFTSTVEDITQMRSRPEADSYFNTFSFTHGNTRVTMSARFDRNLNLIEAKGDVFEGRPGHYYQVADFTHSGYIDEAGDAVVLRISLTDINKALAEAANSEPITEGSRLSSLYVWTAVEMKTDTGFGVISAPHDDSAGTSPDEYWAVGS